MPADVPNPWPGLAKSLHPRFALTGVAATASSRQATHALDALCTLLPVPTRVILSDNGSEFLGPFQQRLDERGITPWWP